MKLALEQFNENLSRAHALSGLAKSLNALTTTAVDLSDIYLSRFSCFGCERT